MGRVLAAELGLPSQFVVIVALVAALFTARVYFDTFKGLKAHILKGFHMCSLLWIETMIVAPLTIS